MFVPVGSLVNAAAIAAGGLLGIFWGSRLSSGLRTAVFHALGLCLVIIGLQMGLALERPLVLICSLLSGGLLGAACDLDRWFYLGGERLKALLRSGNSRFSEGFVNGTALFLIGSMAVIGPLDEGLTGDASVLFTKSVLDLFFAVALAAAFGNGVILAALPILLVEGLLTLLAGSLQPLLTAAVITDIKSVGGALILGVALNTL
ncbi:MAG: DUF554 domain-containing protein, partial [Deltaproteobacteria bacterium]|nr:DUF554 domain-containing protein [Deltaproteobacteria bacterium]